MDIVERSREESKIRSEALGRNVTIYNRMVNKLKDRMKDEIQVKLQNLENHLEKDDFVVHLFRAFSFAKINEFTKFSVFKSCEFDEEISKWKFYLTQPKIVDFKKVLK